MYLPTTRQWLKSRALLAASASVQPTKSFCAGASTGYAEDKPKPKPKPKPKGRKEGEGGSKKGSRSGTSAGNRSTPMMRQYWKAKEEYPDCVLLFRMGDFFEVFFDDAKVVSSVLRIALTRRYRKSGQMEDAIPMCGIPHYSLQRHLARLVKHGLSVAICDQVEQKDRSGGNAYKLLKRRVVQLVTPGTLIEEGLLQPNEHNYLVSLVALPQFSTTEDEEDPVQIGLAQLDLSTGEFKVAHASVEGLRNTLFRFAPSELVVPNSTVELLPQLFQVKEANALANVDQANVDESEIDNVYESSVTLSSAFGLSCRVTCRDDVTFFEDQPVAALPFIDASSISEDHFAAEEVYAIRGVLDYVKHTQCGRTPRMNFPSREEALAGRSLELDTAAVKALEVFQSTTGDRAGSLLSAIDRTSTGAGSRLLYDRLTLPLACTDALESRLDAVEFFVKSRPARVNARKRLAAFGDVHRCLQRVEVNRCSPRDLWVIAFTLGEAQVLAAELNEAMENEAGVGTPRSYGELSQGVEEIVSTHTTGLLDTLGTICRALMPTENEEEGSDLKQTVIPGNVADGGFIAAGFNAELDELRDLRSNGHLKIKALEEKYQDETGIRSLKIKSNLKLGYFVEVSNRHLEKLSPSLFFQYNQTSAATRFKTEELNDLEINLRIADEKALQLEMDIFKELCDETIKHSNEIVITANALARIDVSLSFAHLAVEKGLSRPTLESSSTLVVEQGRHLIVEENGAFVPNSLELTEEGKAWLITGPNMGGKSTFLRQNAHIIILAQTGSFVPCAHATVGMVDRLFCRVGASDELKSDRSTFMIEMEETAAILNNSTDKSFVIVDEVGRGTSPREGIAIAQAVLEELTSRRCRTLFATHFHDLAHDIPPHDPRIRCYAMSIAAEPVQTGEAPKLSFLYTIQPGVSSESYGLYVAQLAGVPSTVIARAVEILGQVSTLS